MTDTLLLIEDEALLGDELMRRYRRQGWDVVLADSLAAARRYLIDELLCPLVVLSDLNLPDGNTLNLLESLQQQEPGAERGGEWVFLTGVGGVPDSVRALRLGAFDFLEKPADLDRLDLIIAGAARSSRAQRRLREQSGEYGRRYTPDSFLGRSQAAAEVRRLLGKLTRVPFSALTIGGETGTGKGLVARILHHGGERWQGPLVEINCAALPRELLESELFGHEAGAFTGAKGRRRGLLEQAHGGTLFLDEIGEMTPDLQVKLLKVIEDKTFRRLGGEREIAVDVQVISATNKDLAESVEKGEFRGDLYHRLNVFNVTLPPLRSRPEDLEDLLPPFVAEYNAKARKQVRIIPDAVWAKLAAHRWPGNVRELRNVIERCVLFADSGTLPLEWLQLTPSRPAAEPEAAQDRLTLVLDGSLSFEDMERCILQRSLERHGNNISAAARALSMTRETLRYRVDKFGLLAAE